MVYSSETKLLTVVESGICQDVVNRECVGRNTRFSVEVGKLFCLTRIEGAATPTEITHVWFFEDTERARIKLYVGSSSWRTYSSKIIQRHEIGAWQVTVLGAGGELLETIEFEATP
jgi:hypothetical protein